jgi:hypothetical protein
VSNHRRGGRGRIRPTRGAAHADRDHSATRDRERRCARRQNPTQRHVASVPGVTGVNPYLDPARRSATGPGRLAAWCWK